MKKLLIIPILCILSGCEAYKKCELRPKHFDIHITYDENSKITGGFTGFGWDLP